MKTEIKKRIATITGNQSADDSEILIQVKDLLDEIELENKPPKDSKTIFELFSENLKIIQSDYSGNLIKTGFASLDREIGGFSLGEFVVIGGRPSMGKTQLLTTLALNISLSTPVLYFTYDLSEYLLTSRFMASLSGIATNKILQNNLTDDEKIELFSLKKQIQKHKIFINDSCHNSVSAFKAQCLKQIQENGIKIIIVDCLQMMSSKKDKNDRKHEINNFSKELKNIARDNNVCVIASSQLSRAVEFRGGDMRPQLSDLRESGAIEQDADKVFFIYRLEYYGITEDTEGNSAEGQAELIISKNKNGSLGTIKLQRDAHFTTLKDLGNPLF